MSYARKVRRTVTTQTTVFDVNGKEYKITGSDQDAETFKKNLIAILGVARSAVKVKNVEIDEKTYAMSQDDFIKAATLEEKGEGED